MSTDLIDSNLIIYAAQSEHDELRGYIADEAPFVSVMSKVETLGYHGLDTDAKAFLEDFFGAAAVLPVSQNVVEEAIRLRQKRNMVKSLLYTAWGVAVERTLSNASARSREPLASPRKAPCLLKPRAFQIDGT